MSRVDCGGSWRELAALADGTVALMRCDGCGDLTAIYRHNGYTFDPGTSEREVLTTIWAAVGRSVAA